MAQVSRDHSNRDTSNVFDCYRIIGNHQMYEVLNDTAVQTSLAIKSGDSIRRVAQHLHTPYGTVRQAVNRLEDAGYVAYDDGLSVVDDEKTSRERVALAHKEIESYDPSHYETQLVRAIESVLSSLGWDRTDIRQELSGAREPELTDFQ